MYLPVFSKGGTPTTSPSCAIGCCCCSCCCCSCCCSCFSSPPEFDVGARENWLLPARQGGSSCATAVSLFQEPLRVLEVLSCGVLHAGARLSRRRISPLCETAEVTESNRVFEVA